MRHAAFLLLLTSFGANAVVIRDDVPDLQYRMAVSDFPALADVPGEGHGVLIAPQWVVTAAHAVSWQHSVDVVVVGGTPRAVSRVVIHPGYKKAPQTMIDAAMKSGDWADYFDFTASSDDIALIQLAEPVRDVAPARIYNGSALGKSVRIMGRGATGTGSKGHHLHGPNRTDLRHGYNEITVSGGRWVGYTFDKPPNALPLEATTGSGDSGGPILVAVDNEWHVAGIAAWKRAEVNGTEIYPGRYGETSYGVRLGHYADWIETTTTTVTAAGKSR
ncbi:trypsin-like serine protease [Lysobacter sp. CFH 32150]|uniref:S1 family peptidase n=1 Tax=Lysobacter sp. CFH 32150 TaxID=2927128 RepID=UPI001FA6F809|nr:trypsin-like serine protease [Lysobacter sp. CFH 32150]MCI4566697.1 trypsin-like serine protease [Lysobacter sp. CFH 32150]